MPPSHNWGRNTYDLKIACILVFDYLTFLTLRNKSLLFVNFYCILYCYINKTPIKRYSFFLFEEGYHSCFRNQELPFFWNPLLKDSTLILQNIFLFSITHDTLFSIWVYDVIILINKIVVLLPFSTSVQSIAFFYNYISSPFIVTVTLKP